MKVGIVVGHNAVAKGARARAPLSVDEFSWNDLIADEMVRLARPPLTVKKFHRQHLGSYSREIDEVYGRVDEFGADATVELHFNAATPAATGTETLSSGSSGSMALAQSMQDAMLAALGRRDRGVKLKSRTDRGGRSLHAGRAPAILVEPFFGSNAGDCRAAADLDVGGMAEMYLAGVRAYAGLPDIATSTAGDDATSSAFLADVDIVHSGLTREAFLVRNRDAFRTLITAINRRIQAQEHGEQINALTLQDACALMNAQVGMKGSKVDARFEHESGNRGLLPLPANLGFWNGPPSLDLGSSVTPERNVKEYLLYLANLKNKDIGRSFWGGSLYRDLFTQESIVGNPRKQTAVLAAIVHGYFDTANYHLGLPYAEISSRVVAADNDPTPLLALLDELGYKDLERDPAIVDARIADLKEGLRLSRA
jgi:N-acetylmuramoyl-L-alanine amidase